jgi:hypothetical protein
MHRPRPAITAVLLLLWLIGGCVAELGAPPLENETATVELPLFSSREVTVWPTFSGHALLSGTSTVVADGLSIPVGAITMRMTQDDGDDGLELAISGGPLATPVTMSRPTSDGTELTFSGDLPIDLTPLAGTADGERLCADDLGVVSSASALSLRLVDGGGRSTTRLADAARVAGTIDVLVPELRAAPCVVGVRIDIALSTAFDAPFDPRPAEGPPPADDDPTPAAECASDADCAMGEVCVSGACEPLPRESEEEPADESSEEEPPADHSCPEDDPMSAPPSGDGLCAPGTGSFHGESCAGTLPETWRCMCHPTFGLAVSQVCRDGIWQSYHLRPRDCDACHGEYTIACRQ